jgi:molybdopterin-guanine dinucleotide biosynthesis protein A
MTTHALGALILCGGESRRMGRPKAWLPFGGQTLLERTIGRVRRAVGEGPIVVVAAPGQDLPPLPEVVQTARDPIRGRGPLQGLAAGLAAMPASAELVYATATDAPFLAPAWIGGLVDRIGDADLAIADIGGFLHPLAALYRRATVWPAIERLLAADRLRPVYLLEELRAQVLTAEEMRSVDPPLETLRNLNTPEDYERALADWARHPENPAASGG